MATIMISPDYISGIRDKTITENNTSIPNYKQQTSGNSQYFSNYNILIQIDVDSDGDLSYNGQKIRTASSQADYALTDTTSPNYIKNKPKLALIATSGKYSDLVGAPDIPTHLSQLLNDSEFITATTTALINYYTKSEAYSKEEINEIIGNLNTVTMEVTEELPTENISTSTIYLIANTDEESGSTISSYAMWAYIGEEWTPLGTTEINLTNYYSKEEIDTMLSGFVAVIDGKGLSEENFTTELKEIILGLSDVAKTGDYNDLKNLPNIPQSSSDLSDGENIATKDELHTHPNLGNLNKISENSDGDMTYNGKVVGGGEASSVSWENINNKPDFAVVATSGKYSDLTDLPSIPVKLSQLLNDTAFITNAVSNLLNYYKKTEVYTKTEVGNLISNFSKLKTEIVEYLPEDDIDTSIIYLIRSSEDDSNYIQWMYISNEWANLGNTTIDLTGYVRASDLETILEGYVEKVDGYGLSEENFTNDYKETIEGLSKVATTGSYSDLKDAPDAITVDSELNDASENPVQNKVIAGALENLSKKSKQIDINLSASNWSSANTYTITLDDIANYDYGTLTYSYSSLVVNGDTTKLDAKNDAQIEVLSQTGNTMVLIATGSVPTVDIPIILIVHD